MRLFFPAAAEELDFSTLVHLDGEVFTDLPEGSRREPDIVVQVNRLDGVPEIILVHVEVQAQRRDEVAYRMWEYYCLLRMRKKLPVLPIVIYLAPGAGGLVRETHSESLFGETFLEFAYRAIGLPDLSAEEYIVQDNPLAMALSALMKATARSKVDRKIQALGRLFEAELNDAEKRLLSSVVDSYLELTEEEEIEMEQKLQDPTLPPAYRNWVPSWAKDAHRQGIEQGIERGIERGRHEVVLRLIALKFGEPSPATVAAVEAIRGKQRLDDLLNAIFAARSLEEVELTSTSGLDHSPS